jgi:GGDEF domain-containing protein
MSEPEQLDVVIQHADAALYTVKRSGKGQVRLHTVTASVSD